jgi:hypothetical protein
MSLDHNSCLIKIISLTIIAIAGLLNLQFLILPLQRLALGRELPFVINIVLAFPILVFEGGIVAFVVTRIWRYWDE